MMTVFVEGECRLSNFNESQAVVTSVSLSSKHEFSKSVVDSIKLIAGYGVEGDAHAGATTEHVYLKKKNPDMVNLTQVHLIHEELFNELENVKAGDLGENITTKGIDLLSLPLGTLLHIGESVVEVTGLRSPCVQMNSFQPMLIKKLMMRGEDGTVVRKSGIMGIVVQNGVIVPGDSIVVELPAGELLPLLPV